MLDETMWAAQAGGVGEELDAGSELECFFLSAFHLDRHHAAKARHLRLGDLMPGMTRQAGIMDRFNLRLAGQELRDLLRALRLRANAIWKGLQAAQGQPAFKGRGNRASFALYAADFFKQHAVVFEDQRAAEHITMAGEIFGDRMHDDIGAELKRAAQ